MNICCLSAGIFRTHIFLIAFRDFWQESGFLALLMVEKGKGLFFISGQGLLFISKKGKGLFLTSKKEQGEFLTSKKMGGRCDGIRLSRSADGVKRAGLTFHF